MKPWVTVVVPIYNLEDHLEAMLKSIKKQSFKDFEVLLINDGSKDGSLAIANSFAESDSRFKVLSHENRGVSETRNRGIEEARGEYIIFFDGDDYIPPNSIKDLVSSAKKEEADITIGIMQVNNDGSETIATARRLVKQKSISPGDTSFIHAWSVCNKLYSLPFLIHNNLRFEPMKHSEDAVFTYATLAKAKKITGCNSIVYKYIKRSFWSTNSATQTLSEEMLKDLFKSHDRIIEEAKSIFTEDTTEKREEYFSKLYARFISNEVLEGFYKKLWLAEEAVPQLIMDRIDTYRQYINEKDWARIAKKHKDIFQGQNLLSPQEVKKNPKVTLLVTENYLGETTNEFLSSLYAQQYPRFNLLVEGALRDRINPQFQKAENLEFVEGKILVDEGITPSVKNKLAEYVMIPQDHIYLSKDSLYVLARALENEKSPSISSCLVKYYDGTKFSVTKEMESAFGYVGKPRVVKAIDSLIGNKLFRRDKYPFSDHEICSVVRTGIMLSDLDKKQFDTLVKQKLRLGHFLVNSSVDLAMKMAKRKLAREDVDLILKRFNRDSSEIR